MATEAEPSHAQQQRMWNATQHANVGVVDTPVLGWHPRCSRQHAAIWLMHSLRQALMTAVTATGAWCRSGVMPVDLMACRVWLAQGHLAQSRQKLAQGWHCHCMLSATAVLGMS
jgi:hypothetical protein